MQNLKTIGATRDCFFAHRILLMMTNESPSFFFFFCHKSRVTAPLAVVDPHLNQSTREQLSLFRIALGERHMETEDPHRGDALTK